MRSNFCTRYMYILKITDMFPQKIQYPPFCSRYFPFIFTESTISAWDIISFLSRLLFARLVEERNVLSFSSLFFVSFFFFFLFSFFLSFFFLVLGRLILRSCFFWDVLWICSRNNKGYGVCCSGSLQPFQLYLKSI